MQKRKIRKQRSGSLSYRARLQWWPLATVFDVKRRV